MRWRCCRWRIAGGLRSWACARRLPTGAREAVCWRGCVALRGAGAAGDAGGAASSASPEHTPAVGSERLKVALLTGCVQRLSFAHVNEATVRVLAAEGCRVDGARRAGLLRRAAAARRATSSRRARWRATTSRCSSAPGVDRIVVNAAGCGSAMKEYGELFADDPAWAGARARRSAAKVRDVSEVLVELGEPRAARHPIAARVVYHDACHLAHGQGVRAQPRALLQAIPGVELRDAGRIGDLLRQRRHLQPGAARTRPRELGARKGAPHRGRSRRI